MKPMANLYGGIQGLYGGIHNKLNPSHIKKGGLEKALLVAAATVIIGGATIGGVISSSNIAHAQGKDPHGWHQGNHYGWEDGNPGKHKGWYKIEPPEPPY